MCRKCSVLCKGNGSVKVSVVERSTIGCCTSQFRGRESSRLILGFDVEKKEFVCPEMANDGELVRIRKFLS